ncbi:uncharacterized protein [Diadema antillarum]|uniref:uncharacterized protein n=1 Tax=Diadema antillarum TaxID=105358 RepID=UPI003A87488E
MSCFSVESGSHVGYGGHVKSDVFTNFSEDRGTPSAPFCDEKKAMGSPQTNLLRHVNDAKKNAVNPVDFTARLFEAVCDSVFMTVLSILILGVPASMIYFGFMYLDKCPGLPLVPLYLVANGSVLLFKLLLDLAVRIQRHVVFSTGSGSDALQYFCGCTFCSNVCTVIAMSLFFANNFWLLSFEPVTGDRWSRNYCHPFVYSFSVWMAISPYVLLAGGVVTCFCTSAVGYVTLKFDQTGP